MSGAGAYLPRAVMITGMAATVAGLMNLFAVERPARLNAPSAPASDAVLAMAAAWDGTIQYGPSYAALDPSRADFDAGQSADFDPSDDYWGLPRTAGFEEVAARCGACHSLALVMQQRQNAAGWTTVIDRMIARQGMPAPDAPARASVVAYLTREFGRD